MNTNNNRTGGLLAGLIFPVVSFIYALFHPNNKNFKLLFVLFFTFIGLAIFYKGNEADITRSVVDFYDAYTNQDVDFFTYFKSTSSINQIDYYSTFMVWLVSRFTNNPKIYLGCLALVFALFFVANTDYLIKHSQLTSRISIILLIVFIVTPKIAFLTHRWWTALQVFLFGMLPVIFEKKYWKLLWCFAAAYLVHFSFLYPLIILVISLLLPKKYLLIYLVLYIITVLINSFDFSYLASFVTNYLPDLVASRTETYINAEILEHNFFSQSARIVMNIANVTLCTIIYITNQEGLKKEDLLRRVFVVALLLGSFANLTALTEWGWRYLDLTNMLFVAFYALYLSDDMNYKKSLTLFKWTTPLFLYFIAFQVRGFLAIIGPFQLLFGNYLTTWFLKDTSSVWNLLGQ